MSGLPDDPTELGASELSAAIRERKLGCVEVMQAYLDRIGRYNSLYNAIVSMPDEDELLRQAAEADRALDKQEYRGWMHGMPHAIKDLSDVRGLPTSLGSPITAGTVATSDDLFVSRIRACGAIFIGKTNTPEFGIGSQTYNGVFGTTRNAFDPELTAGGSSGGAAAGVATRMLPCADGSDMMGSLRNPAAYNNVIGFRPSQGRVPRWPASDVFYRQLDTVGPMGRNVEDTVRLLGTMAGCDPRSPLSLRDPVPDYAQFHGIDLAACSIGWMGDYDGYLATEPGVLELCERSLGEIARHGAAVETCRPDFDLARLWQAWLTLRHWSVLQIAPYYADAELRAQLKPEIVWEFEGAQRITAQQIFDAGIARSDWLRAMQTMLDRYDVLALPSAQVFPFAADTHWPRSVGGVEMDTYHRWMEVVLAATMSGLPAVTLPAGFDAGGRPMGMQFIGRVGQDRELLEFAMAYEACTEHLARRPALRESL